VARALDLVGERWTLLILRDLFLFGARRYQDFLDNLEGMSPSTLAQRLKALEDNGLVERRFYEQHPPRAEYHLTRKGRDLGPVLKTLKTWGDRHARPPSSDSGVEA